MRPKNIHHPPPDRPRPRHSGFAPPKGGTEDDPKDRFVPVGDALAALLTVHMRKHPPVEVTLPWMAKDGEPVTVSLVFTTREHKPLNKNYFNYLWKGGLEAIGRRYRAAA
ncbi:hypothetical protein [Streptomyces sp. NPDC058603]|uniref:hypothetical protein n=1 Tax=Streptomyces sp. NPDC058603 TaxID=3346551 RepID=UPI00366635FF